MKSNLIDRTIIPSIKAGTFNAAMGRSRCDFDGQMMSRFDGTNTTGIFRLTFQQKMFYIVTDKNTQVPYPVPLESSWKDRVLAVAKNVFNPPATRSSPSNDLLLNMADGTIYEMTNGHFDSDGGWVTNGKPSKRESHGDEQSPTVKRVGLKKNNGSHVNWAKLSTAERNEIMEWKRDE